MKYNFSAGEEIGKKAGEAKDAVVHTTEHATDKLAKGARDAKTSIADAAGSGKHNLDSCDLNGINLFLF